MLSDLARHLRVTIPGAGGMRAALAAPSIDLLPMPAAFDFSIFGPPPAAFGAAVDPDALTRVHLLSLMAAESGWGQAAQGARAAAALAASPATSALFTCESGALTAVADRVLEIVASEDDEVRCAAMSAVANIAEAMASIASSGSRRAWLEAAVAAAAKCCRDDHPHVRREALRCAQALAAASGALAARFVSLGAKPMFALYAEGADDGACPDKAAERFAKVALAAC
jgi:hypothetical protein